MRSGDRQRRLQAQPGAVGQDDVAHLMRPLFHQIEVGALAEVTRGRQHGGPRDLGQRDRLDASAGSDQRHDQWKGGQRPDQSGPPKGIASDDEAGAQDRPFQRRALEPRIGRGLGPHELGRRIGGGAGRGDLDKPADAGRLAGRDQRDDRPLLAVAEPVARAGLERAAGIDHHLHAPQVSGPGGGVGQAVEVRPDPAGEGRGNGRRAPPQAGNLMPLAEKLAGDAAADEAARAQQQHLHQSNRLETDDSSAIRLIASASSGAMVSRRIFDVASADS